MFDRQMPTAETPPSCPMCASPMILKEVHRRQPNDHFIFKCGTCGLEYPVVRTPGISL